MQYEHATRNKAYKTQRNTADFWKSRRKAETEAEMKSSHDVANGNGQGLLTKEHQVLPLADGHTNVSFCASRNSVMVVQLQRVASDDDNQEKKTHNGRYGPPQPNLLQQYPARAESLWRIAVTIFVPFLLAGLGMVLAGIVLDEVQRWTVFKEVDELFVMIPALLGLKGNLEMTSASRLSTAANIGKMNSRRTWWVMASGSISITQAQSIVIGCVLH